MSDGSRGAAPPAPGGVRRRRLPPRHLCPPGSSGRGVPRRGRPSGELEPRLPLANLHLQPRRHLPPHAHGRADRGVGGRGRGTRTASGRSSTTSRAAGAGPATGSTFHREPQHDVEAIEREVGDRLLRPARRSACSPTSCGTRSCTTRPTRSRPCATGSSETVRWFAEHPELQLLIRVHPAEITGMAAVAPASGRRDRPRVSRPARERLRRRPGQSGQHVRRDAAVRQRHHLRHQDRRGADRLGVPVIVAGEAWIRGKGVTRDVHRPGSPTPSSWHTLPARRADAARRSDAPGSTPTTSSSAG